MKNTFLYMKRMYTRPRYLQIFQFYVESSGIQVRVSLKPHSWISVISLIGTILISKQTTIWCFFFQHLFAYCLYVRGRTTCFTMQSKRNKLLFILKITPLSRNAKVYSPACSRINPESKSSKNIEQQITYFYSYFARFKC